MMMPLLTLIVLLLLAILAVAIRLAFDVRAIRFGQSGPSGIHKYDPHLPCSHLHDRRWSARFAVWEWREGQWCVILEDLPVGVDPGPAPAWPGSHEGVRVRTWIPGRQP